MGPKRRHRGERRFQHWLLSGNIAPGCWVRIRSRGVLLAVERGVSSGHLFWGVITVKGALFQTPCWSHWWCWDATLIKKVDWNISLKRKCSFHLVILFSGLSIKIFHAHFLPSYFQDSGMHYLPSYFQDQAFPFKFIWRFRRF